MNYEVTEDGKIIATFLYAEDAIEFAQQEIDRRKIITINDGALFSKKIERMHDEIKEINRHGK